MIKLIIEDSLTIDSSISPKIFPSGSFDDYIDKDRSHISFSPDTEPWQIYRNSSSVGEREYIAVDKAYDRMVELEEILDDAIDMDSRLGGRYDYKDAQDNYDKAYKTWLSMFNRYKEKADRYMQSLFNADKIEIDPIDGFITVYTD